MYTYPTAILAPFSYSQVIPVILAVAPLPSEQGKRGLQGAVLAVAYLLKHLKILDQGVPLEDESRKLPIRGKIKKQAHEEDLTENEIVPHFNVGIVTVTAWRRIRDKNPYRFPEPTYLGGDKFFWTVTQQHLWEDYYDSQECMKNGTFVMPKGIKDVLTLHEATKYRFVVETLKRMVLFELMCLTPTDGCYCPILVRQFHCTVFFHDDTARTMTWMT
jgi:hypothetical protein